MPVCAPRAGPLSHRRDVHEDGRLAAPENLLGAPKRFSCGNYTALGYAKRKLGDFDTALQAYDAALAINPDYGHAIEYRGEAYLGLGRINEAQNAYRILSEKDLTLAAELLGSMQAWIEARRAAPEGISAEQLDGFAGWVADRELTATGSTRHKGSW